MEDIEYSQYEQQEEMPEPQPDWSMFPITRRVDDTYTITYNGLPYHCTPSYCPDLYEQVHKYALEHPEIILIEEPEPEPTEEEIAQQEIQNRIFECRIRLQETDYIALKLAEAEGDEDRIQALKAEYSDILAQRAEWRKYINDNM